MNVFRPSLASFLGSALYALSPAAMASGVLYFTVDSASTLVWIVAGVSAFVSLFLVVQSVTVHLQRLFVSDEGLVVKGVFGGIGIRWPDVTGALLRERVNIVTRTDHLLVLESPRHKVLFNTSTLRRADEEAVLAAVRRRINLVVQKDRPAI